MFENHSLLFLVFYGGNLGHAISSISIKVIFAGENSRIVVAD